MSENREEIEAKIRGSLEALEKMKPVEIYHPDYPEYVRSRGVIVEDLWKNINKLNKLKA